MNARDEEMGRYQTKDSGKRQEFETGMVRDTQEGKARFDLLFPLAMPYKEQLITRFAELMARGAEKYAERNWEQARTEVELGRYKASALRHLIQWLTGETDEDHAAAVMFNLMGAEYVKYRMRAEASVDLANELAEGLAEGERLLARVEEIRQSRQQAADDIYSGDQPERSKCGVFMPEFRAFCIRPPLHTDGHLSVSGESA